MREEGIREHSRDIASGGGWISERDSERVILEILLDQVFTSILLILPSQLVLEWML
jgi:hypothetical protein